MKIKSLVLENFRAFLGKHRIDFSYSNDKNLTIIVAENEVGKSTLLNALVWCFYGELTHDTDTPQDLIHDDAKNKNTFVEVTVEEDGQEFIFKRFLDKKDTKLKAWKTENDVPQRYHLPESLINTLLPKQLRNYFLFSGEELKDIIEEPNKLEKSIHDIQGLTAANEALKSLSKYRFNLTTQKRSAKNKVTELDNKKEELESMISYIKNAEDEKEEANRSHQDAKKATKIAERKWDEIKSFDAKTIREDEKRQKGVVNRIKEEIKILQDERKALIPRYGIDILGYTFVEKTNQLIRDAGDKGYPSKYHKTIINDSLAEDECKLCERSFKNDKKIKNLLESKLLTSITGELQDQVQMVRATIDRNKEAIDEFNNEISKIESKIDKKTIDLDGEEKLHQEILSKINELAGRDKEADQANENYKSAMRKEASCEGIFIRAKENLTELKREQSNLATDIQKLEVSQDANSKLGREINFLLDCENDLKELIQTQEKQGKEFIFHDMNESLKKHSMGNHEFRFQQDTYNPEIIKSDGRVLKLSTGGKILKKNLFFVTSLIKHSRKRRSAEAKLQIPGTVAPLIVDAPFSALDPFNVSIAARVLLESSEQLIVMINSGSFNGGFLDVLKENKNKHLKGLGKVYVLKRNLRGSGEGKDKKEVDIFGKKFPTANYNKKYDESIIEDLNYGK